MDQIVFAAMREPVAKRVVVDVAFDMIAKGFKVKEESEEPNPEWSRQVSRVLDELDTKEKLRELVIFERLYGWAALGLSIIDYGKDPFWCFVKEYLAGKITDKRTAVSFYT